jgi:anti-sigma B factor antagonist
MASRVEVESRDAGSVQEISLRGAADLSTVAALKEQLLAALAPARDVVLRLDALDRLDGAGVQLLLATRVLVERAGHSFVLRAPGSVALRAMDTMGVTSLFSRDGLPPGG